MIPLGRHSRTRTHANPTSTDYSRQRAKARRRASCSDIRGGVPRCLWFDFALGGRLEHDDRDDPGLTMTLRCRTFHVNPNTTLAAGTRIPLGTCESVGDTPLTTTAGR